VIPATQSSQQQPPKTHSPEWSEDAQLEEVLLRSEKRRRLEQEEEREEDIQDRALQASAEAADEPPLPTSYAEISETAKARKASNIRRFVPTASRARRPWSLEETELLIKLISKRGCTWSAILKEGGSGFYDGRDQVALKDKARNIKVDLLL
jgi:hypothetical protein